MRNDRLAALVERIDVVVVDQAACGMDVAMTVRGQSAASREPNGKETNMHTALAPDLEPWCEVVRTEYQEMPGLRLTLEQARRLWSVDAETCRTVIEMLVGSGYLMRTDDNLYCRADQIDGAASLD